MAKAIPVVMAVCLVIVGDRALFFFTTSDEDKALHWVWQLNTWIIYLLMLSHAMFPGLRILFLRSFPPFWVLSPLGWGKVL